MSQAHADSVRDYLFRALETDVASGPIDDATATAWRQQTGSTAPVLVTVRTVGRFKQPGCKRLEVTLTQEGVQTREGPLTKISLPWQMNLCKDGSPPVEGMDTQRIRDAIANTRPK